MESFDELLHEEQLKIYGGMVETFVPMLNEPWAYNTPIWISGPMLSSRSPITTMIFSN